MLAEKARSQYLRSMSSPPPIIAARSVVKRFGDRTAVDGLDLEVQPGVCFGLLGPNGAGKTTTLRMLYGVTRPTAGSIEVFGLDIATHRRAVRARLGVTLQENVLVEALDAKENLMIFGRYHLLAGAELERRAEELIDFLDLQSHRSVPVRDLSGGYQRRLAIALSLMNRPELLVLDEPTTGLDPAVRLGLWSRVRALRDEGRTVVITTHYMDEAERLCDEVAIIDAGRLIARGAPRELIATYLAPQTVEIDCGEAEEARLLEGFPVPKHRLRAGRRAIFHLDDGAALVEHVHHRDPSHRQIVSRPTGLEDVFLHLTGTGLERAA